METFTRVNDEPFSMSKKKRRLHTKRIQGRSRGKWHFLWLLQSPYSDEGGWRLCPTKQEVQRPYQEQHNLPVATFEKEELDELLERASGNLSSYKKNPYWESCVK